MLLELVQGQGGGSMKTYTVTTFGCREYLCRMGMIAGILEYQPVLPRRLTIAEIQTAVASHYHIPLSEMTSARRTRDVARPRQVAMFLAKSLTPRSYPAIGRMFGNRDHTTVLHAIRKIKGCIADDSEIADDVRILTERLAA